MAGQKRNILWPILQRRNRQLHHRKPVVEILAELPLRDRRPQVAMRRGDHPDIHLARGQRPNRHNLLVLDRAQQLGLRRQRHVPNLIQKERSSIGKLKQPGLVPSAPVNAPRTWPNSSLSNSVSTTAEQFSTTNLPAARLADAARSPQVFPAPVGPWIRIDR